MSLVRQQTSQLLTVTTVNNNREVTGVDIEDAVNRYLVCMPYCRLLVAISLSS